MDAALSEKFSIHGSIDILAGSGGLPKVRLRSGAAEAEVYLYGAHVTRYAATGQDILWTSPLSPFSEGKPIRGGIPVVFPWFGGHRGRADFPAHGFARIRNWELTETSRLSDGRSRAVLTLSSDDVSRALWPYDFCLELAVTVGSNLRVELTAANTGLDPFAYEDCLHSYFAVGDVAAATVEGLAGRSYLDRLAGDRPGVQDGELRPAAAVTKFFDKAPPRVVIRDAALGQAIVCEQAGAKATVVWTPWDGAERNFPDIGANWKRFLCVEAANAVDNRVVLPPGALHRSVVEYRLG